MICAACINVANATGMNSTKAATNAVVFAAAVKAWIFSISFPRSFDLVAHEMRGAATMDADAQKKSREPLGWFAASLVDRRRRVWGDQATIKAAWLRVASATGANKAKAAAKQRNLDICGSY